MILPVILTIEDESSQEVMIRLYKRSLKRMFREARKYASIQEVIEDIVSDSIVQLVDKVELLRELEENKRIAYAITTVRHMAYRYLRREKLLQMTSFDNLEAFLAAPSESTDDAILREQRRAKMRELLGSLPTEDLLLLEEKYILEWTDAEIAATLGIQTNSVRMRLTRAKRRVSKALAKQGFQLNDWL